MKEDLSKLQNFRFQCIHCDQIKQPHNTTLFVNWEKRYYLITCITCDRTEVFDEKGQRIELEKKTEEKEESEVNHES